MVCDKCLKNLETRFFEEFDNRNLCYNCAVKEAEQKDKVKNIKYFVLSYKSNVEYKFERIQEELDEEKYYSELADKLISKCYELFKIRDINELLKLLNLLLNRKDITESEYFFDNFFDFIADELRENIYELLNKNEVEYANQLSIVWTQLYSLLNNPIRGMTEYVRGDVLNSMGKVDEALNCYILSLLVSFEGVEWDMPHEETLPETIKETWDKLKSLIEKLKRDSSMLPKYEEALRGIPKTAKPKTFEHNERLKIVASIMNYAKKCNGLNKNKMGEQIFKLTDKIWDVHLLNKPVTNEDKWDDFINLIYQIFYEGSGALKRIPPKFLENEPIYIDIKYFRNHRFHDLEHGDEKDKQKKELRLKEIYLKYTKKESLYQLSPKEFDNFSLKILKELKIVLGRLLKYLKN